MSKIPYYKPVFDDGNVYSIDNIRINFLIDERYNSEFISSFISSFWRTDIDIYPATVSQFKFRHLIKINYAVNSCMVIGYQFNGTDKALDCFKGYLDFNPNKVGSSAQFWSDYRQIKSLCESFECARVDIALDIPCKRENLIIEKDSRRYCLDAYSHSNKTEYLGRRSNPGFVKVYNKSIESDLDTDITRIEVTCLPCAESYFAFFPRAWNIEKSGQVDFLSKLDSTDFAILQMELRLLANDLDAGLMIFNSLGRTKKQKLKKFLLPESCLVFPSSDFVNSLFLLLSKEFLY